MTSIDVTADAAARSRAGADRSSQLAKKDEARGSEVFCSVQMTESWLVILMGVFSSLKAQ